MCHFTGCEECSDTPVEAGKSSGEIVFFRHTNLIKKETPGRENAPGNGLSRGEELLGTGRGQQQSAADVNAEGEARVAAAEDGTQTALDAAAARVGAGSGVRGAR